MNERQKRENEGVATQLEFLNTSAEVDDALSQIAAGRGLPNQETLLALDGLTCRTPQDVLKRPVKKERSLGRLNGPKTGKDWKRGGGAKVVDPFFEINHYLKTTDVPNKD